MRDLLKRFREVIRSIEGIPYAELTRGQRIIRFLWQMWIAAYRQMRRDRAGSNAAALTFRTLFSILPLLVLAASLAKATISPKTFYDSINDLAEWFHLEDIKITMASGDGSSTKDLVEWMQDLAQQAMALDLTGLTWIGIGVVLYSAFRLVEEVDATFNIISRSTPSGWIKRRIWIYLGIILLAPLLTVTVVWMLDRAIEQVSVVFGFVDLGHLSAADGDLHRLAVVASAALCYRLVPARAIRRRPAALGAASATLLLLVGQWLLTLYIDGAVRSSPLGGSLGFVPVFMFWMYMMWLSVLYGLEITMVTQRVGDLRQRERFKAASD